jgi:hypothetical protein
MGAVQLWLVMVVPLSADETRIQATGNGIWFVRAKWRA